MNSKLNSCVFCNIEDNFSPEQMIYHNDRFYLCVPKGQIVEGFLILSTYQHVKCMSELSKSDFSMIEEIICLVNKFYSYAYQVSDFVIYEQGRAGGGAEYDTMSYFPYHFHLCFLPIKYDFFSYLDQYFDFKIVDKMEEVISIKKPYFYIWSGKEKRIYFGKNKEGDKMLETYRFKKIICKEINIHKHYSWRENNDAAVIEKTIKKFGETINNTKDKS